jgi:hypothetical protein
VGLNHGGDDKKQGKNAFRYESGFPVFLFLVKEKKVQKDDGEKDGEEGDHILVGFSQKNFQAFCRILNPC